MTDWYYEARVTLSGKAVASWLREHAGLDVISVDLGEVHVVVWRTAADASAEVELVYAPRRPRPVSPAVFIQDAIAAVRRALPAVANDAEEIHASVVRRQRDPFLLEAVADAFLKVDR